MNYTEWRTLSSNLNSKSAIVLCEELLRWHSAKRRGLNFETDYTTRNYEESFKNAFTYYIDHISNPFTYNKMYNMFLAVHEENVIIKDASIGIEKVKVKTTNKKPKVKNQYYKLETKDIFGKTTYNYVNPKTGDSFFSDDPNLLDELNKKKVKTNVVSLENMTFSFKKK